MTRYIYRRCHQCNGGGKALGKDGEWKTCPTCQGSGETK